MFMSLLSRNPTSFKSGTRRSSIISNLARTTIFNQHNQKLVRSEETKPICLSIQFAEIRNLSEEKCFPRGEWDSKLEPDGNVNFKVFVGSVFCLTNFKYQKVDAN